MIDHLSTYAVDYPATRRFYESVLGALGHTVQMEMEMAADPDLPGRRACAFGLNRPVFWVIEAKEPYSPRHVAFSAANREQVNAFHAAGLKAGGSDHGEPGPRPIYHEHYFGSFLLDPDGNNVEAVCHLPAG